MELGVAQAQDPGAALHPLAPAREELLGVPECQHPVLGVDLVLDFHHLLHPLSSSTGLKAILFNMIKGKVSDRFLCSGH